MLLDLLVFWLGFWTRFFRFGLCGRCFFFRQFGLLFGRLFCLFSVSGEGLWVGFFDELDVGLFAGLTGHGPSS